MYSNALARAASPYLRQHQHNPVQWMEWGDEAFARARAENKLVLISVGYAACHWCHVMAHESFEDAGIAEIMNLHFICVKVDREERPDVDQIYLEAVQLMTGRGGWPLNCFALPDGKPVFGGTYFRPGQWREILLRLSGLWKDEPEKVSAQADQLTAYLRQTEARRRETPEEGAVAWPQVVRAFAARFDTSLGGTGYAPKFPMPCEWQFLLRYGWRAGDESCLRQVRLTLNRMAQGGIHDQLGGGFARYSTDAEWKAPHFEKMLYDNAQLLELYAEAGAAFGEPLYREVALGIAEFLERELAAPEGGYCSSLDADSEGEEGRYYVWTQSELEGALGERYAWFADRCGVGGEGLWEGGKNILLRRYFLDELAGRRGWTLAEAESAWEGARRDLLAIREQRPKPMLDDKVLTSWNGLLIRGFAAAYRYTGEDALLRRAMATADFLLAKALRPDGGLWHRGWHGAFAIEGFLEDYAFLAEGLIELYQVSFQERYLDSARGLAEYALAHFHDPVSPLLFFTADTAPAPLVRKKEVADNVIPSSNAAMARVLSALGDFFAEPRYQDRARALRGSVAGELATYGPVYAYWAQAQWLEDCPMATLAVVGPEASAFRTQALRTYLPHVRLAGSEGPSELPLLKDKHHPGAAMAYRCEYGTCGLPTPDWRTLLAAETVAA